MPRLGLIVILALGLVVTTPVVCVCGPTDHGGQALHSLLPHSHDHATMAGVDHDHTEHLRLLAEALPADSLVDDAPAPRVTAQTGAAAGAFVAGAAAIGLALAQPWQLPAGRGAAIATPSLPAPASREFGPAGPPPRLAIG